MNRTKRLTLLALAVAVAMMLSYIELLLPPVFSAVPGIKMGLANIAALFVLYKSGVLDAAFVSLVRVALSSLLFGTALTFVYSLAGAVLSLAVMWLLKKTALFSVTGVSVAGAVSHNVGQIIVAVIILGTKEIMYYMAVLAVTGIISGVLVGLLSGLLIKKINLAK